MSHAVGKTTNNCFLCRPDPDLTYRCDGVGVALCGLGPLMKGYTVAATRDHVRSAADAAQSSPGFLAFASDIRKTLTRLYGKCLMTEHGRLPVCVDVSGTSEPHCYHAHFLLFPGAPAIEDKASAHFSKVELAHSLADALLIAGRHQDYYLLSPENDRFLVMSRPGRIMRQFSRYLVAESLGCPELANWRKHQNRNAAVSAAAELKQFVT